jgi:hypothetical protein
MLSLLGIDITDVDLSKGRRCHGSSIMCGSLYDFAGSVPASG